MGLMQPDMLGGFSSPGPTRPAGPAKSGLRSTGGEPWAGQLMSVCLAPAPPPSQTCLHLPRPPS